MKKLEVNRPAGSERLWLTIRSESGDWDSWVVSLQVQEKARLREDMTPHSTGQAQTDKEVYLYSPRHMASLETQPMYFF